MAQANRLYPASWNAATKVVTSLAIVVTAVVALHQGVSLGCGGLLLMCTLAFLFAPRGYTIGADRLLLHRPIGVKAIPFSAIAAARRITDPELDGVVNLWGNAGLFGVYGHFYSGRFGLHRWYASRSSNLVALKTGRGVLIISPDRVDDFLSELKLRAS